MRTIKRFRKDEEKSTPTSPNVNQYENNKSESNKEKPAVVVNNTKEQENRIEDTYFSSAQSEISREHKRLPIHLTNESALRDGKKPASKQEINVRFMNKNYSLNRPPSHEDLYCPSDNSKDPYASSYEETVVVHKKKQRSKSIKEQVNPNKCSLCTESGNTQDLNRNEQCSHVYHKKCLNAYVKSKIDQHQFPFRCPVRS